MNKNLFLITVLGCLIIACTPQNNPGGDEGKEATAIKLSKNELALEKGANETLTVSFTPSNVANKALTWVSSNKNIAEVTDGIVVGVNAGSTEIIVKSGDLVDKCVVTVVVSATSITLEPAEVKMAVGGTVSLTAMVLPNDTTDELEWSSSDESVASVKDGVVGAVALGTATITAKAGAQTASCNIIVKTKAIDLGFTIKWADCNLGATTPEEYGDYYAWGETETKSNYLWSTYKFGTSSSGPFSKYETQDCYVAIDNKTVLDPEDDAVHVKLGGSWRMPTNEEWTALRTNCTWTWTDNYNGTGVAGRIVTSNVEGYKDKSIFLPAAGYRLDTTLSNAGSYGDYWSSSLYADDPHAAWYVRFSSDVVNRGNATSRCYGFSVRPVSE